MWLLPPPRLMPNALQEPLLLLRVRLTLLLSMVNVPIALLTPTLMPCVAVLDAT
ncbi:MAG: hypothetical protein IPJ55_18000 [Chloracidobacterium sp.]|nr:hypothetical protein [Chloracidobacterium sp.]